MADVIWVTQPLVQVFTSAQTQSIDSAIDVSAYDELYLRTFCLGVDTPSSPSVTVSLFTGMQTQTADGWIEVFHNVFTGASAVGGASADNLVTKGTFLRYIRWQTSAVTGATSMSFWMAGVARTYAADSGRG